MRFVFPAVRPLLESTGTKAPARRQRSFSRRPAASTGLMHRWLGKLAQAAVAALPVLGLQSAHLERDQQAFGMG